MGFNKNKDEMIPVVFFCYSLRALLPKESFIRSMLKGFGSIVSILSRPSYNEGLRSYFLVEFSSVVGSG